MAAPLAFYLLAEYTLTRALLDQFAIAGGETLGQGTSVELARVPAKLKAWANNKIAFEYKRTNILFDINQAVTLTINNPDGSITYRVGVNIPYDHPIFNFPEYDDRGSNALFD